MGKDRKGHATIGVDIGGTKTLYALFDQGFEVLAEEKLRTQAEKDSARAFNRGMKEVVGNLVALAKKKGLRIDCVGVGCAGDIDVKQGIVRSSPNVKFLAGYPMRERLARLAGAPVFVANDVHAGLYGEFCRGAARKGRHVIGIWIGTGVGGALIIDGRLHLGATGRAGDIGNYLLHPVDAAHDSPRKERLDSVASRHAIAGMAASLAAKQSAPALRKAAGTDVSDIKAGDIAEAIKAGDKAVEKLVRSRARVLGGALANLVDFVNPDVVVLGGGLVEAMPRLLRGEVAKTIKAHSAAKASRPAKVVVAKLARHAGTVGAACLAREMLLGVSPPIDLSAL